MSQAEYQYLGDKQTDARRKKSLCSAVRNERGKCVRGKNGNFLVRFEDGTESVVVGRLLRKIVDV